MAKIELTEENLPKKIKVIIRPKHFKQAISFSEPDGCPLYFAINDIFDIKDDRKNGLLIDETNAMFYINDKAINYKIKKQFNPDSTVEKLGYEVNELIKRAKQKKKVGTFTVKLKKRNNGEI